MYTLSKPSLDVGTSGGDPSENEVLVFEAGKGRRLVAAVQIVSPSNKDRPEISRAFVAKCAAYVQKGVSVTIVDAVTIHKGNLYGDLLDLIGQEDKSLGKSPPPLYAATCRRLAGDAPRFQAWSHTLQIVQPLPTLPLWLDASRSIPLDFEESYEDTCLGLGIE